MAAGENSFKSEMSGASKRLEHNPPANISYLSFESFSPQILPDELALVLVTYGTGTFYCNGTSSPIKRGLLCFLAPLDACLFEASPATSIQAWVLQFKLDVMLDFVSEPFLNAQTFQVLVQKRESTTLEPSQALSASEMIRRLAETSSNDKFIDSLQAKNVVRILFYRANTSLLGALMPAPPKKQKGDALHD